MKDLQSIELSLSLLIDTHLCCTKLLVLVSSSVLRLLFTFVMRLTKFSHNILVHWHVIMISCKTISKQLARNTWKSMDNMRVWCTQMSNLNLAVLLSSI